MARRRLRLAATALAALGVTGGVTSAVTGPAAAADPVAHQDSGPVAHADRAATLRVGSVTLRPIVRIVIVLTPAAPTRSASGPAARSGRRCGRGRGAG